MRYSRSSDLRTKGKIRSGRVDARVQMRARADQWARVVSGLGRNGLTGRPQLQGVGERVRGERSDPDVADGIRSGLIEIGPSDQSCADRMRARGLQLSRVARGGASRGHGDAVARGEVDWDS
jgi:hypothetical protein